ncbi:MAG: DUF1292 domain-containing protein [Erysipelotrichaceae bacterium]|nr:DUF1292 domain-containing protein [Erysipelotrichaceae bacterium]MBR2745567.1 DUF1292 domain-containing protein [Erysipelotrichaceae bacterium]
MDTNTLFVTTEDGQEKQMEILFTFDSDEYGKSYVLFYDPADEEGTVYTMSYDDKGNLYQVESEAEWEMINEVFEVYEDGAQEN